MKTQTIFPTVKPVRRAREAERTEIAQGAGVRRTARTEIAQGAGVWRTARTEIAQGEGVWREAARAVLAASVFLIFAQPVQAQNFANWTPEQAAQSGQAQPALKTGLDSSAEELKDAQAVPSLKEQPQAPAAATFSEEDLKGLSPEERQALMGTGLIPQPQALPAAEASSYTLGPTDVITITVMRHPEVSGEYPINNEGKIQYEFVGDILVSGLNKEEAEEVISQHLSEFIVSPEVTVKIAQYNSKIVYVVGEVAAPGKIFMRGDTITVREALMQAGLPRLGGITKKSHLITPSDSGKPKKKYIDVYALLYQGDLRENDTMYPGDVLYIPPTFLTKVMRTISPVAAPIGQAAGATTGVNVISNPTRTGY